RPAHPIRLMVSLLILKSMYNLSDEVLVEQQWEMNPYFQYFGGFEVMQWGQPCAATDLVHFRKRIGTAGIEKIFKHSIDLHGKDAHDKHVSIDTTVQEKNITYPTDAKIHKKITDKCVSMAKKEGVKLRRSYVRTTKQLVRDTYNGAHPKRRKKANAAKRKLKTIAGRLVRELDRKLPDQQTKETLALFKRVLSQERNSKNKIYSLHEPGVYCIAKGKAHKKYEYGCKGSVVLTQNTGIIVGAMTFEENIYDGHTLETVLNQTQILTGNYPKTATVDRGYKGTSKVKSTTIIRPSKPLKRDNTYQKQKKRKHCRRRAAIEPIIGHIKKDHRAVINYLKGKTGDKINFIMSASGFNYKKLMKKLRAIALWLYTKLQNKPQLQIELIRHL
ncbi:IS5 family transposase, partial [Reichenbachiella agariperforans]|uniref:IS5 family transposase n=1 Tax=Reichenbachiella agariperforans TaxID=156994 RepID=UPI001C094C3E